jgi:tetratricopeptide (TPR) repeat protein
VTGIGGTTIGVLQGGTLVQGDLVVGGSRLPAMESISAKPGLGRIPESSDVFVGRSTELERLDSSVARSGRAVVIAVHGLGGVGKSALAAHFAHRHRDRHSLVWWITADSAPGIDTGLADLATALTSQAEGLPLEQRTKLAVRWLATHDDWLLVLDNLTTPTDTTRLLERVRTGTIVITSRQSNGWRSVETIPLDVLSAGEARELLARIARAEWPDPDLPNADRLCSELGRLPLAVEQAGAYIAQTRITPTAYIDLLKRYPAQMFAATSEGGHPHRTMARVWHLTLDKLTDTPLAGQVLRQLAWYAPGPIPRHLITTSIDAPETDLLHALGRLAAYSMITLTPDTVSVHRLVQAVTRTPDPNDPFRQPHAIAAALHTATSSLARTARTHDPLLPGSWAHYQAILLHAQALLANAAPDTDTDDTCLLLHGLGIYLHDQGNLPLALAFLARDHLSTARLYGPSSPDAVVTRSHLAGVYASTGRLAEAAELHRRNLTVQIQTLGTEHPSTLDTRDNLGTVYWSAGDLKAALTMFETNLTTRELVLGFNHPDTFSSRGQVAAVLSSLGDYARAIPLLETALAHSKRVLGPQHRDTLVVCNNLGSAYSEAGDLERAVPLLEKTLTNCERVLGPDHPDTLAVRNNLAHACSTSGETVRVISLLETNRTASTSVLGADHPYTLDICNELATAYHLMGDTNRAVLLLETTLSTCEQRLPADHPITRDVRANLRATKNA